MSFKLIPERLTWSPPRLTGANLLILVGASGLFWAVVVPRSDRGDYPVAPMPDLSVAAATRQPPPRLPVFSGVQSPAEPTNDQVRRFEVAAGQTTQQVSVPSQTLPASTSGKLLMSFDTARGCVTIEGWPAAVPQDPIAQILPDILALPGLSPLGLQGRVSAPSPQSRSETFCMGPAISLTSPATKP